MKTFAIFLLLAATATTGAGGAGEQVVPLTQEPHHHLVFENEYVRAFRVELPAHQKTLLHSHGMDYLYLALGAAEFTNLVPGMPDRRVRMADAQIGFAKGGFAHAANNLMSTPFRNFTIEFKHAQAGLRNECTRADPNQPLHCGGGLKMATRETPEFETDEAVVTLAQVEPGAKLELGKPEFGRLMAALDNTSAGVIGGSAPVELKADEEVWVEGAVELVLVNEGKTMARVLCVAFKDSAKQ